MITTITTTVITMMISKITDKGTIIARSVDVAFLFPLNSEPPWLAPLVVKLPAPTPGIIIKFL